MYIFVAMCESLLREECGCCKVTAKHHCLDSFFFNFKAYPSYISSSHRSNSSKVVSRESHTATTKPFFDIFCMCMCVLYELFTLDWHCVCPRQWAHINPHCRSLKCTTDSQWPLPQWVTTVSFYERPFHLYATTMGTSSCCFVPRYTTIYQLATVLATHRHTA